MGRADDHGEEEDRSKGLPSSTGVSGFSGSLLDDVLAFPLMVSVPLRRASASRSIADRWLGEDEDEEESIEAEKM